MWKICCAFSRKTMQTQQKSICLVEDRMGIRCFHLRPSGIAKSARLLLRSSRGANACGRRSNAVGCACGRQGVDTLLLKNIQQKDMGMVQLHLCWYAAMQPVLNPLGSMFLKSKKLGNAGWSTKFGNQFYIVHAAD